MFSSANTGFFGKAPTATNSLFSTNTNTAKPGNTLFDNNTSNTSLLGTSSISGGLFGSNTNQSVGGTSLFGNSTSTFPRPENSFNSFGGSNLFGSTPNTTTSNAFGSTNPTTTLATTTGIFGSAQPQNSNIFGTAQSQPSIFDGSSSNSFLTPQITGTKNISWRDEYRQDVGGKVQCITAHSNLNQAKCLEELRWEDYQLQRLPGNSVLSFGTNSANTSSSGLFNTNTTAPSNTSSIFGTNTSIFNNPQQSISNTTQNTGLFGSTTTPTTGGLFDMNKPAQTNTTGLFGNQQPKSSLFSTNVPATNTVSTGSSLFGTQQLGTNNNSLFKPAGTGLFGSAAPSTNLFGSTNALGSSTNTTLNNTSLFGKSTPTQPFGTSSLLNNTTKPLESTSLFGKAAAPTLTTGGGLFGATDQQSSFLSNTSSAQQAGTSLFDSSKSTAIIPKPPTLTGDIFGKSAPNTSMFSLNSSLGSAQPNTSTSLFNTSVTQPATTTSTSLFGNTQPQTNTGLSLFNSQPASSSLFKTSNPPSSLYNNQQPTSSIFGTNLSNFSQPSLSTPGTYNLGSTSTTPNMFPSLTPSVNTTAAAPSVPQLSVPSVDPYGLSRLQKHNKNSLNTVLGGYTVANPFTFPVTGIILPTHYRTCRSATFAQLWKPLPEYSAEHRRQPVNSLITPKRISKNRPSLENRSANRTQPRSQSQKEAWTPFSKAVNSNEHSIGGGIYSEQRRNSLTDDKIPNSKVLNKDISPIPTVAKEDNRIVDENDQYVYGSNPNQIKSIRRSIENSRISDASLWLSQSVLRKPLYDSLPSNKDPNETPFPEPTLNKTPMTEMLKTLRFEKSNVKKLITCTRKDYRLRPSLEILETYTEQQLANVQDFTVIRDGFGEIMWLGATDVRGLNVDQVVIIEKRIVEVYPEQFFQHAGQGVPPVGVGLNKPAIVTLYGCGPQPDTVLSDDEQQTEYEMHLHKMRHYTERIGAQFISLSEDGVWKFRVDHFSKYGLIDEPADSDVKQCEKPSQSKSFSEKTLEEYYENHCKELTQGKTISPDFVKPPKSIVEMSLNYFKINAAQGCLVKGCVLQKRDVNIQNLEHLMETLMDQMDCRMASLSLNEEEKNNLIYTQIKFHHPNSNSHFLWRLIDIFFGPLQKPLGVSEEDKACQESRQRLNLFSSWLKQINFHQTKLSDFIGNNEQTKYRCADEALYYIVHNDLKKAVNCLVSPTKPGDQNLLRLALCLSSLGAATNCSPIYRESHYRQLCEWQKRGLYTYIPAEILRIHHIVAGCIDQLVASKIPNWKSLISLLIWFLSPDATLYIRQKDVDNEIEAMNILNAHISSNKQNQKLKKKSMYPEISQSSKNTKYLSKSLEISQDENEKIDAIIPRTSQVLQRAIELYEKLINRQDTKAPSPLPQFIAPQRRQLTSGDVEDPMYNILKLYTQLINLNGLSNLFEAKAYSLKGKDIAVPLLLLKILNPEILNVFARLNKSSKKWMELTQKSLEATLFEQLEAFNLWWWKLTYVLSQMFLNTIQLNYGFKIISDCFRKNFFNLFSKKRNRDTLTPLSFLMHKIRLPMIFYFHDLGEFHYYKRDFDQAAYFFINAFINTYNWDEHVSSSIIATSLYKYQVQNNSAIYLYLESLLNVCNIVPCIAEKGFFQKCLPTANISHYDFFKTPKSYVAYAVQSLIQGQKFNNLIMKLSSFILGKLNVLSRIAQHSYIVTDSIEISMLKKISYEALWEEISETILYFTDLQLVLQNQFVSRVFIEANYSELKTSYYCTYLTENLWPTAEWYNTNGYSLCVFASWCLHIINYLKKNEDDVLYAIQLIKLADILMKQSTSTKSNPSIESTVVYLPDDLSKNRTYNIKSAFEISPDCPALKAMQSVLLSFKQIQKLQEFEESTSSSKIYCKLLCLPTETY